MRLRLGLAVTLLAISLIANATQSSSPNELIIQKDKIYDPNTLSMDSVKEYEQKFDFNWHDHASIESNKKKIEEIELFLKSNPNYSEMSGDDQEALGIMAYKLGTYYTHIARQPNMAIDKLNLADNLLPGKEDKAWINDQLAFAYEMKYSVSNEDVDKKQAEAYTEKVFSFYPKTKNKEIAFAYCVRGFLADDSDDHEEAEENFKQALAIYEKIPHGKDEQYHRLQSRLAMSILAQDDNRDEEAFKMLTDVRKYWKAQGNENQNPYAARNLFALAQAQLKMDKPNDARDTVNKVIALYQSMYGRDSEQLVQPYQLLADTYKKMGNRELADSYQVKANELDNS